MDLTQKDFDARVARQAAGNATDEDRRLIAHYQDNGFTPQQGQSDDAGQEDESDESVTPIDKPSKAARGRAARE